MIHRRIVQLRPGVKPEDVALPRGINMLVLDYAKRIVEFWGSDAVELAPADRCDGTKLSDFVAALDPLRTLTSHERSPAVIGMIHKNNVLVDEG